MATDVGVQFFSDLNGLTMTSTLVGEIIKNFDICLVNGIELPSITDSSINEQGDILLTFSKAHSSLLLQIVEISGFAPEDLNGKYRIKGVPSTTRLVLKATHVGRTIDSHGSAKLAPLGYEIVYQDTNKRAYRAKNPSLIHPFIRVDETMTDGTNTYNANYAKYAMVGLIENMTHIDDYEDPTKLQLPHDPNNLKKNWSITGGTGTAVIRGWSRWYYARSVAPYSNTADSNGSGSGNKKFTIVGDQDAFYFHCQHQNETLKTLYGCGTYDSAMPDDLIPNWFLMTTLSYQTAANSLGVASIEGGTPLAYNESFARFFIPTINITNRYVPHISAKPIIPDLMTGLSNIYSGSAVAALSIPFFDTGLKLRGTLKHIHYSGNNKNGTNQATPILSDSSMYMLDAVMGYNNGVYYGAVYHYLGEIE